jgi:hypothetical protein
MPRPVRELLRLVHVEGIEIGRARASDFEVATYLRQSNPRLYQHLRRKAARSGRKKQPGTIPG